jgi:hypothetical protein
MGYEWIALMHRRWNSQVSQDCQLYRNLALNVKFQVIHRHWKRLRLGMSMGQTVKRDLKDHWQPSMF